MPSKRITFPNQEGYQLAALLDLPLDQHPFTYAIFAHCFTCGKDLIAIREITRAMTSLGIAVLRFDFTGLGRSEGDFADSNFSSNVDDLTAASDYLKKEYGAPELLVGHSLGGTAVLIAASRIEGIKAVSTIGAPASPAHLEHHFSEAIDKIKDAGSAEVSIEGRPFRIKRQFLEDINDVNMEHRVGSMKLPLLILHSPQDLTVGIDEAKKLYQAAKHPKSFVTLDGADHLMSNKADAGYAGRMIGQWVMRYLEKPESTELSTDERVVVRIGSSGYTTEVQAGRHSLVADEPKKDGGDDFGPTPYDFLLTALGTCTAMTLRMYADRKDWPLEEVDVHLSHSRNHKEDCSDCNNSRKLVDHIKRTIVLQGDLDETQRNRLLEIANRCPVHRTLHNRIEVDTTLD